jgi:hypothetical protein
MPRTQPEAWSSCFAHRVMTGVACADDGRGVRACRLLRMTSSGTSFTPALHGCHFAAADQLRHVTSLMARQPGQPSRAARTRWTPLPPTHSPPPRATNLSPQLSASCFNGVSLACSCSLPFRPSSEPFIIGSIAGRREVGHRLVLTRRSCPWRGKALYTAAGQDAMKTAPHRWP